MASDIEINETVFVDKLIKLKVKGENVSFFTDFIENIDEKKEMSEESYHYLMFRMKWKENYLRGWCGLNYHIFYSL